MSIVIPTHNRPRQLGDCLEAITTTEFSTDRFELIIVNDGGTWSPEETIQAERILPD